MSSRKYGAPTTSNRAFFPPPTSPPSGLRLVVGRAWSSTGDIVVAEVTAGPTLLPTRLAITLIPAFDVVDDDDEGSTGHPRRHPDHPLPRPSLTPFARRALPEPLPAHLGWSTGCWSSSDCHSLGTDAERASTRRSFSTSAIRPPSRRRRPPPSRASTPTFARRPSTLPRAFNVLPATPVVVANHATATFAFDAGLLYVLNDASDVAQLDPLNVLVALLALLAATLIEPRCENIGNPLDDVADAFNVALLNVPDAALLNVPDAALLNVLDAALIDTLALCVAALIERRRMRRGRRHSSSATTRQHVGDDGQPRRRRRPRRVLAVVTAHLAFESGLLVCRGHAANARGYHRSTTVKIHTSTSPLSPASSKGEERRWREGEGRQ
ncbi:hypothetical protein EV121DRAFT_296763 [Schizophyllum commune]